MLICGDNQLKELPEFQNSFQYIYCLTNPFIQFNKYKYFDILIY